MLNLNVVQNNMYFFYVHICFLPLLLVNYTCSFLFLKRERERFPLSIPKALLRSSSNVHKRRFYLKTLKNGQELLTVRNVYAIRDQ